ncbi:MULTISPECIES: 4Fe-4S binding protein [unclassified Candidatus Frackibacter]|uniref:4Fe-4S binding protein n=1 Tax=unclassified Candidatus Frackibacter TaxID=2648818 RepID=UPI000886DCAA|nr:MULTISPECIES: 4Fe-4S binding protein [unclassified Candidatus Frackibacter]SDC80995.1 4Fe-4S binding domain-containing protein [Candidatus Frackibacter sp. WG11]SEM93421.1 4Fe-4S binding domain-containing protein [Candidatus Frackibacter sp. WG12]SFM02465.1 4Fe-4S binding domain-containing protein [Candidatus Frackibacter sp. WG13]
MEKQKWYNNIVKVRNIVQTIFSLFLLYAGWQFYRFVRYFETGGKTEFVTRPEAVDGFLPISALLALKQLLVAKVFDPLHPAALVIFLTIILISFLFKKGFCSWLCPVGTISEWLGKLGEKLFGRTFELPKVVDWLLMIPKYLILGFFVKVILIDMPIMSVMGFLQSPYNLIADVKMLHFFLDLSSFAIKVLIFLAVASILIKNFWCRYLCPYGALLGVVSLVSPIKVTRNEETCINCGSCTKVCPNQIEVHNQERISSPECNACLNCISNCSQEDETLKLSIYNKLKVSTMTYPVLLLGVFLLMITIAKLTGYWESGITKEMYQQFIPKAEYFNH